MSSGVLTGTDASHQRRCVTGRTTVKTDLTKWTVRVRPRAAVIAVTTTLAVSRTPSCVTERETAPMGLMKRSVVGHVNI